jgi:hypothetical protein
MFLRNIMNLLSNRYKFNDVSETRRVSEATVTDKTLFTDRFFACCLFCLFFNLKMEAVCHCEILGNVYQTSWKEVLFIGMAFKASNLLEYFQIKS